MPNEENWPGFKDDPIVKQVECEVNESNLRSFLSDEQGVNDEQAINLIEKILVLNPARRITIRGILDDIYFNDSNNPPCQPQELPKLQPAKEFKEMKRLLKEEEDRKLKEEDERKLLEEQ